MTRRLTTVIAMLALLLSCRQDMHDQPRYKPLAASGFFPDGKSARSVVPGTVARGQLAAAAPAALTRSAVARGRRRFEIFCSPCHGRLGDGDGMVVTRGFRRPPSFHIDRLREAAADHFFDVISNGFGAMPSYASRIPAQDRWAIIAYVRALQLSQRAELSDVPPEERKRLEAGP